MEVVFVSILQKHLLERLRFVTRCFPFLAPDFCAATAVVAVKLLQSSCGLFISDQTFKHTRVIKYITAREGTTHNINTIIYHTNNLPIIIVVLSTLRVKGSSSP